MMIHLTECYLKGVGYDGDDEREESYHYKKMVYQGKDKSKNVVKGLRKSTNGGSIKPKPHSKKRAFDNPSQEILRSGLASKPKSSYFGKKMKHSYITESNKGKCILDKISEGEEDDTDASFELIPQPDKGDDSTDASFELIPQSDKGDDRGKGPPNELRKDVRRTYSGDCSKGRNIENMHGNTRSGSRPIISSSLDNRGKEILVESSDQVSDSNYQAYESCEETFAEESGSGVKDLGNANADNLKSIARDVKVPKSMIPRQKMDYLAKELFESCEIPRPNCKYFVKKLTKRMYELHIPKDIVDDECLELPEKIKLVDPNGDTYPALLNEWTDKRKHYKKAMGRLSRKNFLEKDDFVICEFGEGDHEGYLFISFVHPI